MAKDPITISQEMFIPYIDTNAFLEASFHIFKLVSMIHNASKPKSRELAVVFMAAKEMLKFGYKLGQGLGATGHGSLTVVDLSYNKGGFGLGYKLNNEELFQASKGKKRKFASQGISIPHIKATFLTPIKVIIPEPLKEMEDEELDLACIMLGHV